MNRWRDSSGPPPLLCPPEGPTRVRGWGHLCLERQVRSRPGLGTHGARAFKRRVLPHVSLWVKKTAPDVTRAGPLRCQSCFRPQLLWPHGHELFVKQKVGCAGDGASGSSFSMNLRFFESRFTGSSSFEVFFQRLETKTKRIFPSFSLKIKVLRPWFLFSSLKLPQHWPAEINEGKSPQWIVLGLSLVRIILVSSFQPRLFSFFSSLMRRIWCFQP